MAMSRNIEGAATGGSTAGQAAKVSRAMRGPTPAVKVKVKPPTTKQKVAGIKAAKKAANVSRANVAKARKKAAGTPAEQGFTIKGGNPNPRSAFQKSINKKFNDRFGKTPGIQKMTVRAPKKASAASAFKKGK